MPDDFKSFYNDILQASVTENIPEAIRQRYEFLSCLSFDDNKELYLVRSKQDGVKGILRITKGETSNDAQAEANILRGLDHPAIPKIIGQWNEDDRTFLLREYFDGLTLHVLVKGQGVLDASQILRISIELCDILHYLHRRNPPVIHRDIKPENIILTKDGSVKLIDFGIARQFSVGSTKDTQIIGTEPYMAPEQFGSEQTDGRADIYSLGVVMVYMATGETDKSELKKAYPVKALIPIIQKCIKKDRDLRFASALRLKSRLLRYKRKTVIKLLVLVAALTCIAAALMVGLTLGREEGFQNGIDFIMDNPTEKNQLLKQDELYQPITFNSWWIDKVVRQALKKKDDDIMTRAEVINCIDKIRIFGAPILPPDLDISIVKDHEGKGSVAYITNSGWRLDTRGDISSLVEIPILYFLRELTLISQSITDLQPIAGMSLEKLCLSDNFVGNLLPIKDMVTLCELDMCQNPFRDLTPISRLLSLERLDISQTQVTDLKPLSNLTKLQTVNLAYCDVKDISVFKKLPELREVDVRHTLVTDLAPLIRPDNPVTVWCDGIDKEVVDKVRDITGIILVEDGLENEPVAGQLPEQLPGQSESQSEDAFMQEISSTFKQIISESSLADILTPPIPDNTLEFDVSPLHFYLSAVVDTPVRKIENRINNFPACMVGFSFGNQFGEGCQEAKNAVYSAATLLAKDGKEYRVFSSGAHESDRWDLFFGLPAELSIYDCMLILRLPDNSMVWPLSAYESDGARRRTSTLEFVK